MANYGVCGNIGNCSKADSSERIPIITSSITPPTCPECGQALIVTQQSNLKKVLGLSALLVSLATAGYIALNKFIPDPPTPTPTPAPVPVPGNQNCLIKESSKTAEPNWYAVIEIGAKGIKPIAVEIESSQGKLIPKKFDDCTGKDKESGCHPTQDVTPSMEVSIPKVVEAVCDNINQFHEEYGNIPIYLVGSSSMAVVTHRSKLEEAINKGIPASEGVHLPIDFVTAQQEGLRLFQGIHADPELPGKRRCESIVLDIGSGNVKGGYLSVCDPKAPKNTKDDEKNFTSFEVAEFGTVKFSKKATEYQNSGKVDNFINAAAAIRKEFEHKLYEQVETNPVLVNGEKRIYMAGGAVWALNSMLCLDCPQYKTRSLTEDQDQYTVIKPSDIDEFYRFVIQQPELVCDEEHNPYLEKNLDGGSNQPLESSRIEEQKKKIKKVCKVFVASTDLVSAAEILRAIVKEFKIDEQRHLFFMQNNLYTWSRQYLIEKITDGNNNAK